MFLYSHHKPNTKRSFDLFGTKYLDEADVQAADLAAYQKAQPYLGAAGALLGAGGGAALGALLSKKNKLRNAVLAGLTGAAAGGGLGYGAVGKIPLSFIKMPYRDLELSPSLYQDKTYSPSLGAALTSFVESLKNKKPD